MTSTFEAPREIIFDELGGYIFDAQAHDYAVNGRTPIVIMAPNELLGFGFTVQRGSILKAQAFQKMGFHVLLFDYHSWGRSGGQPRHNFNSHRQLQDWKTAISYVKTLPHVDSNRIILYGSHLSAIYVLAIASTLNQTEGIYKCIVEAPILDFRAFARKILVSCHSVRTISQAFLPCFKDALLHHSHSQKTPYYLSVVQPKNSNIFGFLKSDKWYEIYESSIQSTFSWMSNGTQITDSGIHLDYSEDTDFSDSRIATLQEEDIIAMDEFKQRHNQITARSFHFLLFFSTKYQIEKIRVPCLLQYMNKDQFHSQTRIKQAIMKNPMYLTPIEYEGDYFDVFEFTKTSQDTCLLKDQLVFLSQNA